MNCPLSTPTCSGDADDGSQQWQTPGGGDEGVHHADYRQHHQHHRQHGLHQHHHQHYQGGQQWQTSGG